MTKRKLTVQRSPRCIECGHAFDPAEIAAMTARDRREDLCIVDCSACGAHNEVRAEPQNGFEAQPVLVVRRALRGPSRHAPVFDETVAPGIHPPPESTGRSA